MIKVSIYLVQAARDLKPFVDSVLSFHQHCLRILFRSADFIFRKLKTRNTIFLVRLYECCVLLLPDYYCQLFFSMSKNFMVIKKY